MSVFVTSTLSMFGIALGDRLLLFILMRFRESCEPGAIPIWPPTPQWGPRPASVLSGLTVDRPVDRYLPDRHARCCDRWPPGDPPVGVRRTHPSNPDPGAAVAVRAGGGRRSTLAELVAPARIQVPVLDTLGRHRYASSVGIGVVRDSLLLVLAAPAWHGAGQQHATTVPGLDPGGWRVARRRWALGVGSGAHPGVGFPTAIQQRRRRADPGRDQPGRRGRAVNIVWSSLPMFGDDNCSARCCLRCWRWIPGDGGTRHHRLAARDPAWGYRRPTSGSTSAGRPP